MKKMSYILLLGFLCCVVGGVLSVLGYVRGGMDYVRTADALPWSVVERMENVFSGKEGPKGGVSVKEGITSAGAGGNAVEENASLKTGQENNGYTFRLPKKKLQAFDTIQGELKHIDMKIAPSDDNNAYIKYVFTVKKDSNPFSYEVKDSALVLSEKEGVRNSYYKFVRLGKTVEEKNTNLATLYLPKKQLKSIRLTLGEGDMSIKGLDTKTAQLTLRDGDIWLEASTVKGGKMDSKNGDFIFDDVACENCKFSAGNGDFQCSNLTMKQVELVAENGDFVFDDSTSDNCMISAENGDFQCGGFVLKNGALYAENGDIDLQHSKITDCSIETDCGDVFVDDSTVSGKRMSSDVGDLYFTRSVIKDCEVSTDCGDIDGDTLEIRGNVALVGEESDISVTLGASCRAKVNIYAYTEDGSLDKSRKFKGKVRKSGDSRTYNRDTGSEAMLKIVTEEGDILLE